MTARARRRFRSETGETLIEVLIASVLMALVVFALIGGFGTAMISSTTHREQADVNRVMVDAMERVKSPEFPRLKCYLGDPTPTYLAKAREALPAGWPASALTVTSIKYQNVSPTGVVGFASCAETAGNTLSLQLVTLHVDFPGGRVSQELSFVKGDH